ncbi:sugar phosphate isomerase/epimerase family protein [Alicyclobacillus fastidiosus]|uniref:Sugar phosphate isomerase/epimerase family protein n=1 Tax=Alicyclobacillus fastidiosus TaxID=392011 RepID=A0ABV5AB57_9BACL|nr:sugar phosphate isomerase/epimerase family protein [Alicyclobacillus fastidiosus]WEH10531.1 sugar phosphate isomerase/epimerase [Alicyclobacillus fastidiosus]
MKIAYSNLACPEWSIEEVFGNAEKFGYDGVELRLLDGDVIRADIDSATQERIMVTARRSGIEVIGIGASTRFALADKSDRDSNVQALLRYVELAARMEVPIVRTFGGGANALPEGDEHRLNRYVDWVADALNQVAPRAEALGVQVLLETHDEFSSSRLVADVLDLVGSRAVGALWDTHHPYRVGETVAETFRNLEDRLQHVHLKDARRNGDGWDLVPFDEGEVPVASIVETLVRSGYDRYLCVEWERKWHPEIESADLALPKHLERLRAYLATSESPCE